MADPQTPTTSEEEWRLTPEALLRLVVFLVPMVIYGALIRLEFTYGDGPELLTAILTLGGPHPSGYPLFTLLGILPAHLPWATPYYNVAFMLSAVPTALATMMIFATLRELRAAAPLAALAAGGWALNPHVVYQATRVEVYGLHCLFIAATFWALTMFATRGGVRWAYIAVLATCLGLTNHLTSAFLIAPVVGGLLLIDRRTILRPKTLAIFCAIAIGCAAIYLYLPLQAMANEGDRISWNDPQTFERFWFHVTGAEYSIFRRYDQIGPTLRRFFISLSRSFFPGFVLVAALGAWEWAMRRWRVLAAVLLFELSSLAYMGTYPIRDISTYYTALYIAFALAMGLGLDWFVRARFDQKVLWQRQVASGLIALAFGWLLYLSVEGVEYHYREALAEDMSRQVVEDLEGPGVLFTSVDGHSFPMWYQLYVNHPDKQIVAVDTVMFGLDNKQWYRDYFREHFPWVQWPPDEIATGHGWREWIIEHNPDLNVYAMLHRPWRYRGSHAVNAGWHHRIVRGRATPDQANLHTKHVYVAHHLRIDRDDYFYDSDEVYEAGVAPLACVTEWFDHDQEFSPRWHFEGPGGVRVDFEEHPVPPGANLSWEYLQPEDQTPGTWTCVVELEGERTLRTSFELR